ncbi:MAG: hypothetical protein ACJ8MR_18965 [Povalibacter sp.]
MPILSSRVQGMIIGCLLALPLLTQADVTMEENVAVTGSGLMKMANMSGTSKTTISGNKARTDSDMRFESGMMRALGGGVGQSTEIVRLDEDKIYQLNNKKKTYTETTFAERRATLEQAMAQQQKAQASQQQAVSGVDESQCEWSEPKADVKQTGEKANIGGYQAERTTIVASQACTDKKTGQVCEFGLIMDQWLAPGFEASSETTAYQRAYAEKLGLTATSSRDFAERAQSLFGRYKGLLTEVSAKTRDLKGYPVKASFGLAIGGPQCQSSPQQSQASSGESASAPTSLGGALGGALGGMFGKKKESQPAASTTPPPATINGLVPLMTVSTELISITRDAAPTQAFEVPSEFKKTAQ